ncbi:hypothetical protein D3C81_528370 [compost metagenome]
MPVVRPFFIFETSIGGVQLHAGEVEPRNNITIADGTAAAIDGRHRLGTGCVHKTDAAVVTRIIISVVSGDTLPQCPTRRTDIDVLQIRITVERRPGVGERAGLDVDVSGRSNSGVGVAEHIAGNGEISPRDKAGLFRYLTDRVIGISLRPHQV